MNEELREEFNRQSIGLVMKSEKFRTTGEKEQNHKKGKYDECVKWVVLNKNSTRSFGVIRGYEWKSGRGKKYGSRQLVRD